MKGILKYLVLGFLAAAQGPSAKGVILYSSSFDAPPFSTVTHLWGGVDGWVGTDPTNGSSGLIVEGGAVYLGFVPPAGHASIVARYFGHDLIGMGLPILKVNATMGIFDSANERYDAFALAFYNKAGEPLCGVWFDNSTLQIYYDDGNRLQLLPGQFTNAREQQIDFRRVRVNRKTKP